ncbi:MAG TPA: Ig-like domain repeat protein [Candidatus Eremiobacteraceae bacterium]|nr:Ig-like domain repeat protein [Candidatus Eremiobacteraceae bacterium]
MRLEHTRHPLAIDANAIGRVEPGRPLQRMLLVLSPSSQQQAALARLLDDQHNRNSPNFHQWLSPQQFAAQFGLADADLQTVLAWLQRSGFTIEHVPGSNRWIEFTGTASQVEAAFHTFMRYYRVNGKTYVANSTDLAIPANLAGIIRGPVSLNNFAKSPPFHKSNGLAGRDAQGRKTILSPALTATGTPTSYYLAPGDFAAIYNTTPLLTSGIDGTGISIAVTAQSQIELTDVQQFRQIFGLKSNDPNFLLSGPDPGVANETDSDEALLDVEWAGAVAPGATIDLVVAGTTDTTSGVDLAAAYAIDNQLAPIVTYTYGGCEQALGSAGNAFYNSLWQQAAAEGITVVVSSGDSGAAACDNPTAGTLAANGLAVNGAASTPYNLAVGGTQFNDASQPSTFWSATNNSDYSSALGYIPESTWNESCDPAQPATSTNCVLGTANLTLLASGGGASTIYPKPSWQTGPGVPADNARDLPDLALAAATGHDEAVYCTSLAGVPCQINAQQNVVGLTLIGGTSLSAPAMAGILALVEQKNGALQGQVNYVLYRLAQSSTNTCNSSTQTTPSAANSCVFYDVTSGNNQVPCAGGSPGCSSTHAGTDGFTTGQSAGPGYDLTTGLGSVNAANLAAAWNSSTLAASQTTLKASPTSFVHGSAVTLNGSVSPASGTGSPTGSISIKTNSYGDSPQILPLTSGAFAGAVADLPGGQYNLLAYYPGDATFGSSESPSIALNVTPENSTTTITINGLQSGSAAYGAPLQLKVSSMGNSAQGTPTGTVAIQDGSNSFAASSLAADGTAYLLTGGGATYAFAPGPHSVTASYSGDNSFNASSSTPLAFTINKGTPFVVVGVNTSTLSVGQTLGAHADVSGQGTAQATGTIQFTVDGSAFGTPIALQAGGFFGPLPQASTLIPNLAKGSHVIGAAYNAGPDPNYISVSSGDPVNELTQTVILNADAGAKTTTTMVMNTAPINLGDTGMFTVTVTPSTATGTVTLWDAVGPRTSATPIASGTASIQFPWTQAGSASLYAAYSGDSSDAASASAPVSFTVQKGLPTVNLSAPAALPADGQLTLSATVTGNPANPQIPYPTGIIQFWDSLDGATPQLLTTQNLTVGPGPLAVYATRLKLASGAHSLSAHYLGDTNWQPATSSPMQVAPTTFSLSVSPNPLAFPGGSGGSATVTVTATGGFSGSVALTCATGGTVVPAGYNCSFSPSSVSVNNSTGTSTISFALASSTSAANVAPVRTFSATAAIATSLLFAFLGFAAGHANNSRNFFLACGLFFLASTCVLGCGGAGSGGGGGGPFTTTTTIASNNMHAGFGSPVTLTVTVKPSGSVTPTGQVQLYDNGQAYLSPVSVSAGVATFLATSLPVGVHNFTAHYLGDAHTLASTSASIAQIIAGSITVQISGAANGVTQTASFTVTVI